MNYIIAQILGGIGAVAVALSYFVKGKVGFFFLQTVSNILIVVSFIVQGLVGAGIASLIATIRTIVFGLYQDKDKSIPWYIVVTFVVTTIFTYIIMWESIFDIIYLTGLVLFTLSLTIRDEYTMKCALIIPNVMYVTYKICVGAYGNMIGTLIETIAVVTYAITHRRRHNEQL